MVGFCLCKWFVTVKAAQNKLQINSPAWVHSKQW